MGRDIEAVHAKDAPRAVGPYSQAVSAGGFVFVSGSIPLDPATGEVVEGGIAEQTARAIENARCILNACGLGLENVVKTEVFLRDMDDFAGMNAAYATFFTAEPRPARTTVEVSRLPRDVLVEISCVAYRG